MDQLRNAIGTVRKYLGKLGPTERLLIISFGVILLMGLFVVSQYAGSKRWVAALPGASGEDQQKAAAHLATLGVKHELGSDGQLMVPVELREEVLAQLTAAKKLPADSQTFFKTLVASQHWANTRQTNEYLYNAALKTELDRIVGSMPNVKTANVMFDVPDAVGLGVAVRRPTASVAVFTEDGRPLDQRMIDGIVYLVSGAKGGLSPDRVRVIDPGGQRKATSEDQAIPTTYLEHAAKVESDAREKVSELLSYIPGVIVAVTAQVDVTRVISKEQKYLAKDDGTVALPRRESSKESTQTESKGGSEASVRSNQGTSINTGSGKGPTSNTSDVDKEYDNQVGSRIAETVDPRGMPTMIAVSINVPRGYVAGLASGGDASKKPDDAAILAAFEKQVKPGIRESILPHVRAMTQGVGGAAQDPKVIEAQLAVSLIPLDLVASPAGTQQAGILGGFAGGGGMVMGMSTGQLIDKAVLGVLAVGALGLMFVMVKKAGKKQAMPTAEELVGLPPALEARTDVIGEADESDAPLAGIELADGEVRSNKLLEQVTEMVHKDPSAAAKLIKRWVNIEE